MLKVRSFVVLCVLCTMAGCVAPVDDYSELEVGLREDDWEPPEDEGDIIGGESSDRYPAAVKVHYPGGFCSGVLIAPRLVLTSAHCVVIGGVEKMPTTVHGSTTSGVVAAYVHPDFNQCQRAGTSFANTSATDLALLRLDASPVPAGTALATLATSTPSAGTTLDVIGYGRTTSGGAYAPDRRIAQFRVDGTAPTGGLQTTGLGAGLCSGDSGGPQLVRNSDAAPVIVAITSSQPVGDSPDDCWANTAEIGADVTLASNRAFIDRVLAGTEDEFLAADTHCCSFNEARTCDGPGIPAGQNGQQSCQSDGLWGECLPLQLNEPLDDSGHEDPWGSHTGSDCAYVVEVYGSDECPGGSGSAMYCATDWWGFDGYWIDSTIQCPAL